MSENAWLDPRYREAMAMWAATYVERRPGRPRRVCPHGSGVTLMVNPESREPLNVQCGVCSPGR
ncbi:hypothetical protein GCM10010286_33670 [Streptomyces toxytricini]|nr:hypothetical protein GCM10010286_33670 [Streptomyces toxytricini]